MAQLEKIGALWSMKGKKGEFMAGIIGGKGVLVFKNTHKEPGDKKPDYEVFKGQDREELPPKDHDGDNPPF